MTGAPEDFTRHGHTEIYEAIDPNSEEGRRRSRITLLQQAPNSLRDHVLNLPELTNEPIPEMEYVVEGWVPRYAITQVIGIGGGGKTTLAMQAGAAISLGKPWLGLPTRKMRTLCFLTEDPKAVVHRRADKIARAMGLTLADLPDFLPLSMVKEDSSLIKFDRYTGEAQLTAVHKELRNLCIEMGVQVLILDALHGLFDGNENDRGQARRFCALLTELAEELKGAVILLAHPSKSSSENAKMPSSGSTSWHAGVRAMIHVSDPDDMNPDARTVRLAKINYGRPGEKVQVTWRDGVFQTDEEPSGIFKGIRQDKAERVLMEGLRKAIARGIEPSPFQSARDKYAPRVVGALGAEGLKQPDLERAMNRLMSAEEVIVVTVGPPSRSKQVVIPKDMEGRFLGQTSEASNPPSKAAKGGEK